MYVYVCVCVNINLIVWAERDFDGKQRLTRSFTNRTSHILVRRCRLCMCRTTTEFNAVCVCRCSVLCSRLRNHKHYYAESILYILLCLSSFKLRLYWLQIQTLHRTFAKYYPIKFMTHCEISCNIIQRDYISLLTIR